MFQPDEIRILIVDDDEDDFVITSSLINDIPDSKYRIDWCPRHSDAIQKICAREYDVYFIDYFLGGITGMELLVRAIQCNEDSPMILLTGKGNRDIALQALEAGAADYLVKSELNTEKLERCIRYSLEKAAALKKLRTSEKKFRTIFEQTRDAIFTADEDVQFIDFNSAMERITGHTADEIRGMSLFDLMTEDADMARVKQALSEKDEVNDMEIDLQHQSGRCLAAYSPPA